MFTACLDGLRALKGHFGSRHRVPSSHFRPSNHSCAGVTKPNREVISYYIYTLHKHLRDTADSVSLAVYVALRVCVTRVMSPQGTLVVGRHTGVAGTFQACITLSCIYTRRVALLLGLLASLYGGFAASDPWVTPGHVSPWTRLGRQALRGKGREVQANTYLHRYTYTGAVHPCVVGYVPCHGPGEARSHARPL